MSDKWAVDIAEAMKKNSKPKLEGTQNALMIGRIASASPLKIEINGQIISKHLHINSALLVLADDNTDKIQEAFDNTLNPIVNENWFDFLKEFHQKYVLKKYDEIVVTQSGVSFYILSKVVAA